MLKEQLEGLGIDVDSTVEDYFGDDFSIYEETLRSFINDSKIHELLEALDKKDIKAAFEAAHCLKAIVGMTGYEKLMDYLVVLVEVLRSGDMPAQSDIDAFMGAYEVLEDAVKKG